jgi:hypothetical protein
VALRMGILGSADHARLRLNANAFIYPADLRFIRPILPYVTPNP